MQAINGLRNEKGGANAHPADPEFIEAARLLNRIQAAGGIGFQVRREKASEEATLLLFHTSHMTSETERDVAEFKRLLRLNPEAAVGVRRMFAGF